jgi:hypothetical protein
MTVERIDTSPVCHFLELISHRAERALRGVTNPGVLQLTFIPPFEDECVPRRYAIIDVAAMTADAVAASEAGFNVYVEGRTVDVSLRGRQRGTLEDTVAVFALVIDSDADKGMAWRPTAEASVVVETSPGNHHYWFLLDGAISAAKAKSLGDRIRASTGADHDTGNPVQPYRVAGTLNFPNKRKQARGRVITPTRVVSVTDRVWTPTELIEAFPLPKTNGGGQRHDETGSRGSSDETDLPAELMSLIRDGVEEPRRSDKFFSAVAALKRHGWTIDGITVLLEKFPNGIAAKYARRIRREVERAFGKVAFGKLKTNRAPVAWRDIKDRHGNPAPSLANAVIAIQALGVGCRLDLFHQVILIGNGGDLPEIKNHVGELTEDTIGAIRSLINNRFRLDVGDANALAAVKEIARGHAFDPVVDYLAEVQDRWDGTKRIDTWLADYCEAPDTPFTRAVGRKHMVASVRRARRPGCKYDEILVMESSEGKNKSTAIMVLAGKENFSDHPFSEPKTKWRRN